MIPFNRTPFFEQELEYIMQLIKPDATEGPPVFSELCARLLSDAAGCPALMTSSCSSALDLAAMLLKLSPGDEVIMPSFTFPSTANAIVKSGGIPVFVDIRPDTMNMDETKIEPAVTERTKAIIAVHYAGIACEMDAILDTAARGRLSVIEDAAHAVFCSYKGQPLGSIGDMGCYSFHHTKNFSMGEGGALLLNRRSYLPEAEILRENGTGRSAYLRGEIERYNWLEPGASFIPGEINCAYLYAQLQLADRIIADRMAVWNLYRQDLTALEEHGLVRLPHVPEGCRHNGHIFYIRANDGKTQNALLTYLKEHGITGSTHYAPLHSSPAGTKYGRFHGVDLHTTAESGKLTRLPIYYGMKPEDVRRVIRTVYRFFHISWTE